MLVSVPFFFSLSESNDSFSLLTVTTHEQSATHPSPNIKLNLYYGDFESIPFHLLFLFMLICGVVEFVHLFVSIYFSLHFIVVYMFYCNCNCVNKSNNDEK